MTNRRKSILAIVLLAGIGGAGWWYFHRQGENSQEEENKETPVAHVEVGRLERKTMIEESAAYGSVLPQAGKIHAITLPYESRVLLVCVTPGQVTAKGESLVETEPGPAARLQLAQALNTAEIATRELKQTQERFNQKLAVNTDLNQAVKAAHDAELQVESLQEQGISGHNVLAVPEAAMVVKVNAQEGQMAAQGTPLMELAAEEDTEVKLGVEPGETSALKVDTAVTLTAVNHSKAERVQGRVRLIARSIDTATRLTDVFITLPSKSGFLLNDYVCGEIAVTANDALVVPTSALLPTEGGYSLFTVRDGKAVRHVVKAGLQNRKETQVLGSDLHEGDEVVTVGNYELEDGMAVETKSKAAR